MSARDLVQDEAFTVPPYAKQCDDVIQYSSACGCFSELGGPTPVTTGKPPAATVPCSGAICGTYQKWPCDSPNGQCMCGLDATGSSVCFQDDTCTNEANCSTNSDCVGNRVCILASCCTVGKCVVVSPKSCVNAAHSKHLFRGMAERRGLLAGLCLGGPCDT